MGEKATKDKSRTYESSNKHNKYDMIFNVVPIQMIVPVDGPKTRSKNFDFMKNRTIEKVTLFDIDTSVHAHIDKLVNFLANEDNTTPTKNIVEPAQTTIDFHVEPSSE
ncbi:unnamed protein product [Vicia faba]|uniref:Uncharacterized protein n=1 Tax=Vicia faba TaxID=3906 RepID=A0AAV0Z2Z1_VICFA|nr:unnamed protein product [Vicia faba]